MATLRILPISLLLVLPSILFSQPMRPGAGFEEAGGFELSVSQAFDDEGGALLVVGVAVQYRRLVFLKKGDRYEARYRIYTDIRNSNGKHARGDVWEETIAVAGYDETKSPSSVSKSTRSIPVESDEYTVDVILEVIDTSLRFKRKKKIKIVGYDNEGIGLSAPAFYSPVRKDPGGRLEQGIIVVSECAQADSNAFRQNPEGIYLGFDSWPRVIFNLVGPPGGEGSDEYVLFSRVTDSRKDMLLYNRARVGVGKTGYTQVCLDFNTDDLPLGEYRVKMTVQSPAEKKRSTVEARFSILLNRGALGRHFSDTIALLSIIADDTELADLENAQPDERLAAWRRFWTRRDSSPRSKANEDLEEFLRRVGYVIRNYSTRRAGWETDMGRIHIKYGRPDKIEERQGQTLGTNFRFWFYYSRGILFIFEDTLGTGDFHLVATRQI